MGKFCLILTWFQVSERECFTVGYVARAYIIGIYTATVRPNGFLVEAPYIFFSALLIHLTEKIYLTHGGTISRVPHLKLNENGDCSLNNSLPRRLVCIHPVLTIGHTVMWWPIIESVMGVVRFRLGIDPKLSSPIFCTAPNVWRQRGCLWENWKISCWDSFESGTADSAPRAVRRGSNTPKHLHSCWSATTSFCEKSIQSTQFPKLAKVKTT